MKTTREPIQPNETANILMSSIEAAFIERNWSELDTSIDLFSTKLQ